MCISAGDLMIACDAALLYMGNQKLVTAISFGQILDRSEIDQMNHVL
jgi:hypothetical protein